MNKTRSPKEICIGLSLEGDLLRLAAVGKVGRSIHVLDLASLPLPVMQFVSREKDETNAEQNVFEKFDTGDDDEVDFSTVKEFLQTHFVNGASFSVSLGEPYVRTFLMDRESKESHSKVVKNLLNEIQQTLNIELAKDMVAYQPIGKTSVIAAARVESSPLLDIFALPQGTERRPTRINFVTTNEIALVNLARVHFRFHENEIVHIINVGKEESRLYILRGCDLRYIAPAIQQGANDREFVTMLNNRLELAAENAGYPKADTVVLSGYAEEIGLKEEILNNNPSVVFHSLNRLRIGYGDDETIFRDIRHFLIPISIAWESLQPSSPHFYRINLIPQRIREEQKKLKLAWHGFLLLLFLFVATTALTVTILQKNAEIQTLSSALQYERYQIAEQREIVQQITELENRSAAVIAAATTLDTLLINSESWSETLDTLAIAAGNLQNLWISEMKPEKDGTVSLVGYSLTRLSIPDFSHLIGKSQMREISVQEIGKKRLFRYDISLKIEDQFPFSGSPAALWHDSIKTTLENISTQFGASLTETPVEPKKPVKN